MLTFTVPQIGLHLKCVLVAEDLIVKCLLHTLTSRLCMWLLGLGLFLGDAAEVI